MKSQSNERLVTLTWAYFGLLGDISLHRVILQRLPRRIHYIRIHKVSQHHTPSTICQLGDIAKLRQVAKLLRLTLRRQVRALLLNTTLSVRGPRDRTPHLFLCWGYNSVQHEVANRFGQRPGLVLRRGSDSRREKNVVVLHGRATGTLTRQQSVALDIVRMALFSVVVPSAVNWKYKIKVKLIVWIILLDWRVK